MPAEDDVRKQLDHELFADKETVSFSELAEEYERNRDQVPMVLGGSGPVRVINLAEMEVPDEWKKRYSLLPDKKTEAEISATLDSPPARQNWLDTEPDLELVQQVPSGEREQWRALEAAAIDRRLVDMDRNWMEMAQLCGLDAEPMAVRIFRDEKLLPAIERWRPVIGDKHFRRLSDMWTARLSAREREVQHKQIAVEGKPPALKGRKKQLKGFEGLPKLPDSEIDWQISAAGLTDHQRDCALLKWKHFRSVSEIARRLGKDRRTVQEHCDSARVKIDRAMVGQKKLRNVAKLKPGRLD